MELADPEPNVLLVDLEKYLQFLLDMDCQHPLMHVIIISGRLRLLTVWSVLLYTEIINISRNILLYTTEFPVFLAIKFQVIAMFCPGQNGHSPGFNADNFDTKRQMQKAFLICRIIKHEKINFQYNIEMYILTFHVFCYIFVFVRK